MLIHFALCHGGNTIRFTLPRLNLSLRDIEREVNTLVDWSSDDKRQGLFWKDDAYCIPLTPVETNKDLELILDHSVSLLSEETKANSLCVQLELIDVSDQPHVGVHRRCQFHHVFEPFQHDVRRAFEWLEEQGEPYLNRNQDIGKNRKLCERLRRNHLGFGEEIKSSTVTNANKLYEVGLDLIDSDLFDSDTIRISLDQLEERITRFESIFEKRLALLNQSRIFYTHHEELTIWYDEMDRKYKSVLDIVKERPKQVILEKEGTENAYQTMITEGTELVKTVEDSQMNAQMKETTIDRLNTMLGQISNRNNTVIQKWEQVDFEILSNMRNKLLTDVRDMTAQLESWERDMTTLCSSKEFDSVAAKVSPYHEDNKIKVESAVENLRADFKQLLESDSLQKLETSDRCAITEPVEAEMKELEKTVMQVLKTARKTSKKIDAVRLKVNPFKTCCEEWTAMCKETEEKLHKLWLTLPTSLRDAETMSKEFEGYLNDFEKWINEKTLFYKSKMNEALSEDFIGKDNIIDWNDEVENAVDKLTQLFHKRKDELKGITEFYEIRSEFVVLSLFDPDLESMDEGTVNTLQ